MYMFIRILMMTVSALISLACGNLTNIQYQNKDLVGPEWIVEFFEDSSGTKTDPGTAALSLRFLPPDSLAAKADNDIWGRYIARDGTLSIKIEGYTKKGLSHGSREIEFTEALRNASAYTIGGDKLRIYYFGKTRLLNLVAKQ